MKRISLTTDEVEALENALIQFGNVVTFDQLSSFFDEDRQYSRIRINKLVKQGWLQRIKKGVYVIAGLSSRGSLPISHKAIVNILVQDAYISFETALQHYGLYDQLLASINSISIRQHKSTTIARFTFNFIKTQPRYFYGWETQVIDGQPAKIALTEKALIDLLQFHRTRYSTDLVLEKLSEYRSEITYNRLIEFALQANLTTRRILGFLMDCVGMDSNPLQASVIDRQSISSISNTEDNYYNPKWKLYVDRYFEGKLHE